MTTSVIIAGCYNGGQTASASTAFQPIGSYYISPTLSEFLEQVTIRSAGTFKNMYVRLITNTSTVTNTYFLRDNSVSKNETISVLTAQTGEFEDTVNTDATTAGNLYSVIQIPGPSASGANTGTILRFLYDTTTNTTTRLTTIHVVGWTAISSTMYIPPNGGNQPTTTEGNTKCRITVAGTMKNLFVYVQTNAHTTTSTYNSRVNGANGNLTVSYTSTQTGAKEDTANSDTISAGNDYNIALTVGADSNNIATRMTALDFTSTAGYMLLNTGYTIGTPPNTTAQRFLPIAGICTVGTTELYSQMKAGSNLAFSQGTVVLSANSTGTSTFRFRKNAANGNQVVSISASSTGVFTDSINTDNTVASDEVCWGYTAGAASGVTITSVSAVAVTGYLRSIAETLALQDHP